MLKRYSYEDFTKINDTKQTLIKESLEQDGFIFTVFLYSDYYGIFENYDTVNALLLNRLLEDNVIKPYIKKGFFKINEDFYLDDCCFKKDNGLFICNEKLENTNSNKLDYLRFSGLFKDEEFFKLIARGIAFYRPVTSRVIARAIKSQN